MGWHQEPDVLKNINLTNKQARKSRYGLMGPDPYTDDPHNGVGNVYYGVVETEKFNDPSTFGDQLDDWVTLSKNLAAEKDSRVRVIHKQNGGVSTARNAGLDAAQGNWIAFVDSDDTAAPEYLEKMHKAALETGADFAICSSQCIDETGKTLAGGEHRLLNEFLPQEEVLRRMVVSDFQVPWNKLYRRKLLENLRYPENKAFEDTCLMPVIYARAASACGVWDFLYNYRIVTGSAMHRKTTLKTLDWVEAWYRLFDVLYQNGIRDALCAAYRPILTAVWDIWLHLTPEERKSPRMKEAFAYERTARHRLMQARGVTLKNLWAAVVCAASACSYLDLCRKRAERRQKTT